MQEIQKTQCEDRVNRPKKPIEIMILGDSEGVDQIVESIAIAKTEERCGCPCHQGAPGRWHCFADCCALAGILLRGNVSTK